MNWRVLIPVSRPFQFEFQSSASFILLVEKETVFSRCIDNSFHTKHNCIVITGKGYPDDATRLFLRQLSFKLRLPVLGLFDGDPYGFDILCTYAVGSAAKRGCAFEKLYTTPWIRWVGIHPLDAGVFNLPASCRLPLSARDNAKGRRLMEASRAECRPGWAAFEEFLSCGFKLEIEAFVSLSVGFLTDTYLPHKLGSRQWL
mmetsp:Transcript_44282/g.111573  ORF Transcript_44282/g.111573 Transcript_44282/m.111573 type:complete len:201 (+) Transcript_44282:347-949(+)